MKKDDFGVFRNCFPLEESSINITKAAEKLSSYLKKLGTDDSPVSIFIPDLWAVARALSINVHKFCELVKKPFYLSPYHKDILEEEGNTYQLSEILYIDKVTSIIWKLNNFDDLFYRGWNFSSFKVEFEKFKSYAYTTISADKYREEGCLEVLEKADSAIELMNEVNYKLAISLALLLSECYDEINGIFKKVFNLHSCIEEAFRKYSIKYRKECRGQLNYKPLTPGSWEKVCDDERTMYSLVMEDAFVDSKDERYKFFDMEFKEDVQKNKCLIERLNKINIDGCLWYGENGSNGTVDMSLVYNLLDNDNFLLYCKLALRHNLIQCEVYPELKPKFEAWLKGEENSFDAKDNTKGEETVLKIGARSKIKTIEELIGFIRECFVDDLKYAYDWYALFRFLDVNGYLKDGNVQKFSDEMKVLFAEAKKRCERTAIGQYKRLLCGRVEEWSRLSDEEIKKVKGTSEYGVRRICSIYNIMKDEHDAL